MKTYKNITRLIRYNLAILFPKIYKNIEFQAIRDRGPGKTDLRAFAEPELFFIHRLIPAGTSVADVGANLGLYLYRFEQAGGFKRIIGFEPIPVLHRRLTRYFPGLEIFPYAVSDATGTREFKIPYVRGKVMDTRGTLHAYKEEGETGRQLIRVQTITLDDFIEQHRVTNLSFIKIDIEGHELQAVRGAVKTIRRDKPVLMIEIEQRHHPALNIADIFAEITGLGYCGYFFDPGECSFKDLTAFNPRIHQDTGNMNTYYINNFLFFDRDRPLPTETFREIGNACREMK